MQAIVYNPGYSLDAPPQNLRNWQSWQFVHATSRTCSCLHWVAMQR